MSPEQAERAWRDGLARFARDEEPAQALALIAAAAGAGFAAAQRDLGRLLLHGVAGSAEPEAGRAWLARAAEAGDAAARFTLATLALGSLGDAPDTARAAELLTQAAGAGHPAALRGIAVMLGRSADATAQAHSTRCLEAAAGAGDPIGQALLVERLFRGHGCAPDRDRAQALARALATGSAAPLRPPPGRPPASTALIARHLESALAPPPVEARLHPSQPRVHVARGALSPEEAHLLMLLGAPHLHRSATVDPGTGARLEAPLRTSHDASFDPLIEDIGLVAVQQRMAAFAGLPLGNAEPLILLRYRPGEEYRPHRDYLPPSRVVPLQAGGAGQRAATVIAYLRAPAAGGATVFPDLDIRLPVAPGAMLLFDNLDAAGDPDPRTLHAGEPVLRGEKWVATLWIRQGRQR